MKNSRASDGLVRLYFVHAFDTHPPPDKQLSSGRFSASLAAAGCPGSILIRGRMITAISETKFRTTSGLPISLVSLHGKDDLLVLGPAWAIERVAGGESPSSNPDSRLQKLRDVIETIENEVACLSRLEDSLSKISADPDDRTSVNEVEWLFRAKVGETQAYFTGKDVEQFSKQYIDEAKAHIARLKVIETNDAQYPVWWSEWDSEIGFDVLPNGRNVSSYPISPYDSARKSRPTKKPSTAIRT